MTPGRCRRKIILPNRREAWTVWTTRSPSRLRSWRPNGLLASARPSATSLHHIAGFLRERHRVSCCLSALACPRHEVSNLLPQAHAPAATRLLPVQFQSVFDGSRVLGDPVYASRGVLATCVLMPGCLLLFRLGPLCCPYSHAVVLTGKERPAPYSFRVQKLLLVHLL